MEIIREEINQQELNIDAIDKWFEEFVDGIKTDHLLMTEGVAPMEKKQLYRDLILGNEISAMTKIREGSTMFFISHIVKDYIQELNSQKKLPITLALGLSDSKILVWSVIEDNDEAAENALLIAEAKVNGKYQKQGFYLNSTIIDKSDKVSTPPHYQTIIG